MSQVFLMKLLGFAVETVANIPVTNANEDIVSHYKKQRSAKTEKIVQQYVLLCKERKVHHKHTLRLMQ